MKMIKDKDGDTIVVGAAEHEGGDPNDTIVQVKEHNVLAAVILDQEGLSELIEALLARKTKQ